MSKFFVRKIKIYRNYVWITNKIDFFLLCGLLCHFFDNTNKKNGRKNATEWNDRIESGGMVGD